MISSSANEPNISNLQTPALKTSAPEAQPLANSSEQPEAGLPKDSIDIAFGESQGHSSSGNSSEAASATPLAFAENNFFKLHLEDRGYNSGALKNLFHHAGAKNNVGSILNITH